MQLRRLSTIIAIGLIIPMLAACGGDDDTDTTAATNTPGPSNAGNTSEATTAGSAPAATVASSRPSAVGSVTIDGDEVAIDLVRRCEPVIEGDENLDLTGSGRGFRVFVSVNRPVSGSPLTMFEMSIQGVAPDGVFAGIANSIDGKSWTDANDERLSDPPYTRTADRITGALELNDARDGTETREVSVDIEIPSEILDC